MDQNNSKCPAVQAINKSLASLSNEMHRLEAKSQNEQCGSNSNKPRSKFSWRGLLSYLPSWFRPASPDSAAPSIETTPPAKPNPAIQICHAKPCRPVEAGNRLTQQEIMEKRSLKKPSHERILSSFTFEDVTSDHKTCSEPCKKSGLNICGNKNSNPIQIGVAEVSSHKENKGKNTCACNENKTTKTPISMSSSHCCKPCSKKHSSSNSTCNESLLDQAWAYLQSLISTHRSGCQRCNQRRSNDQMNARSSNDSNTCKQTLLEQAVSYLKKITSDHRSGCSRCQQKQPSCNSNETSYLQTMLEQAWLYLKKMRSDTNACCQRCKRRGQHVCCKHSTPKQQSPTRQPYCTPQSPSCSPQPPSCTPQRSSCTPQRSSCTPQRPSCTPERPSCTPQPPSCSPQPPSCPPQPLSCTPQPPCCTPQSPPGILKYSSSTSRCRCSSQTPSIHESSKKQSCPEEKPRESCPNSCEMKPPKPLPPIAHLCRSSEERLFDKNSCFIPYCKQNSQHSNLALTESHHKSCCLSQLAFDPQKPVCTGTNKKSFDSIDIPIDYNALCPPYNKTPSVSQISREILEYHSSAKYGGPCENNNSKNSASIKQGISLSQEPNDHKFCTRPTECKHSKQSVEEPDESRLICGEDCAGACSQYRPPEEAGKEKEEIEPKLSSCSGGCIKCSQSYTATPMYKEPRMLDSQYEAYLDEHYGKITNQLLDNNNMNQSNEPNVDNQPICDNGCSSVTCIELVKPAHTCSPTDKGPRSDPHNYRYYY